jgi:hypothetical protein
MTGAGGVHIGPGLDQVFGNLGNFLYPIPRSAGDSSGVPQTRQITAEQSPQTSGSVTSRAQLGQYSESGGFGTGWFGEDMVSLSGDVERVKAQTVA